MFSERLENLIKAALKDGVLTEQEKNAIIKRAEAEGEDIDEVDIYIQSLMQEKQQQLLKEAKEAETARIVAQKKEHEARMASELEEQKQHDIIMRKCPACGGIIPALSNVCPHCQHVITGNEADEKMEDLLRKISEASLHMSWNQFSSKFDFWAKHNSYFAWLDELKLLYGELPKVKKFLSDQQLKRFDVISKSFRDNVDENTSCGNRLKKYNPLLKRKKCNIVLSNMNYHIEQNERILDVIISKFGSLPEVQAKGPEFKKEIEDMKSEMKKAAKNYNTRFTSTLVVGILFVIIIAIALIYSLK